MAEMTRPKFEDFGAVGLLSEPEPSDTRPAFEDFRPLKLKPDPTTEQKEIQDSVDIAYRQNIPPDVVSRNFESARKFDDKQQKATKSAQSIYPYLAAGMGGYSPWITRETAPMIPLHPIRTAKEIGKAPFRFGEDVLGHVGGTVQSWLGQFIQYGGIALDEWSKLGSKDPDQIYNPYAQAIISLGERFETQGRGGRAYWVDKMQNGYFRLDPELAKTDPVSYVAGELSQGVASSALSVLAMYLTGGATKYPEFLNAGMRINRGLMVLSGISAAAAYEHADSQGENFLWSTLHGLTDGTIEYVFEMGVFDEVVKGSRPLIVGVREGLEEFFTGMLQNSRSAMLENAHKGMSAYEAAKDAVVKALKQAPLEVVGGFLGGYGIAKGTSLVDLVTKANAMPIEQATGAIEKPTGVAQKPPEEAVIPAQEPSKPAEPTVTPQGEITPLSGELGTLQRPDGGVSTEISVTVTDKRLNNGRPTNIPLLVKGQINVGDLLADKHWTREQENIAIERAAQRVKEGASLPAYETIDEAVSAAIARHKQEERRVTTPQGEIAAEKARAETLKSGDSVKTAEGDTFVVLSVSTNKNGKITIEGVWDNGTPLVADASDLNAIVQPNYYYDAKTGERKLDTGSTVQKNALNAEQVAELRKPSTRVEVAKKLAGMVGEVAGVQPAPAAEKAKMSARDALQTLGKANRAEIDVAEAMDDGKSPVEAYRQYFIDNGRLYGGDNKSRDAANRIVEKIKRAQEQITVTTPQPPGAVEGEIAGPPAPAAETGKPGEVPGGGVDWMTAFRNAIKVSNYARKTRVLPQRTEVLAQRIGAAAATLEHLRKKGVAAPERIWRSMGKLAGEQADTAVFTPLDEILDPWILLNAEEDIATNPKLTYLDKIHLTTAEKTGAYDKLKAGQILTPADVRVLMKWNQLFGQMAKQRVSKMVRFFMGLEQAAGLLKLKAGLDIQIRRQAILLQGEQPEMYAKAVGKNAAAYVSEKYARKLETETQDDPRHADAVAHGARFLTTTQDIEQYVARFVEKIPYIGKVYTASIRGYVAAFNWVQQELWNNGIEGWERQIAESEPGEGIQITEEMKRELVDVNNTLLAFTPAKTTFGRALRRVLRIVMWSPTVTWSRVRTPGMLLTNPIMRRRVAMTLSRFLGSGVMMLMAARIIRGWWGDEKDKDDIATMDYTSTDFLKIKIGNTRFDVYGDLGPYLRAAIQTIAGQKTGQGGRRRDIAWWKPIQNAMINKRSPWIELLYKLETGKEFYGGPAWEVPKAIEDTTLAKYSYLVGKQIYDSFAPLFVVGTIEAGRIDGWPVAIAVGINEFLSGQSVSYEKTAYGKMQIRQDTTAMMTYGKVWDDLAPSQHDKLRKIDSEIEKLEQAADDEQEQWGPPEEINLVEQNRAAENVRRALSEKAQKVLKQSGVPITGLTRKIGDFWLNNTRYEQYQIYATEEIEEETEKVAKRTSWEKKDATKKKEILRDIIDFGKKRARDRVLTEVKRGKL